MGWCVRRPDRNLRWLRNPRFCGDSESFEVASFRARRDRLQASTARRELGFVVADVSPQERVLHCHAARLFQDLDKLLDAKRFLISGARTLRSRETVQRGRRLDRSDWLGATG